MYIWTFELKVAPVWVADGFDPDAHQICEAIRAELLGSATENEVQVRMLSSPDAGKIAKEQGYRG